MLDEKVFFAAVISDEGGDVVTQQSTTGFLILINSSPIILKCKLQTIFALSSEEAEYMAIYHVQEK